MNFNVDFVDLEGQERFDLLVAQLHSEIEVECKYISADIGRKIHRRDVIDLAHFIMRDIRSVKGNHPQSLVVKLKGRLFRNEEQLQDIASCVSMSLNTGQICNSDFVAEVQIYEFAGGDLEDEILLNQSNLSKFIRSKLGIDNQHVIGFAPPHGPRLALVVLSEKPDTMLKDILNKIKTDQFSRNGPAVLCAFLADLTDAQLRGLAAEQDGGMGLQWAATELIARRPHLHTVAFMVAGAVRSRARPFLGTLEEFVSETGTVLTFRNPNHPMADMPSLKSIFGPA